MKAAAPAAAAPRSRRVTSWTVYSVAALLLVVAVVLAAFRVGERAGRLSDWQALVLGVTQGLTELLPISSSGHLILVPWLADWHYLEAHPDFNKTFDVALAPRNARRRRRVLLGRRRPLRPSRGSARVRARAVATADERLAWGVFVATIPAALVGAAGESTIEDHLGQPWQIAIFLAVFAALLWVADRRPQRRRLDGLGIGTAFAIGVSQILALMPGVSRSGITITTGRFASLDRDAAARFSFLLLIPVVFGAVLYKGVKHVAARFAACRDPRGLSSSERSRPPRSASLPSTCCSATYAATTTRRS